MPFCVSGIRIGTRMFIEECLLCGFCRSHDLHLPEPEIASNRRPLSRVQRLVAYFNGLIAKTETERHLYRSGSAIVRNGNITKSEHIDYLTKEMRYKLKRCAGIPTPTPTEQDLEEMAAADKYLGIHRGPSGTTQIEREIKKGMRDWLAPLRGLRRSLLGRH